MTTEKAKEKVQLLRHSDGALWRQVKAAAVLEGCTMTEWVEKLLKDKLNPNSD